MLFAPTTGPLSTLARKCGKVVKSQPSVGLFRPNADTTVAPYTLMPLAWSRPTTFWYPAMIADGVWMTGFSTGVAAAPYPAPRSLMPSSQITWVSPDSPSTSRSSRSTAAGPDAAFATTGLMTRFPPMASLTILTLFPYALCNRRESTLDQRSLVLKVVCVPSGIESPNAQTTTVSVDAMTSRLARKNQDAVVYS